MSVEMVSLIVGEMWITLYMVLATTVFAYLLGLPLGVVLAVTDENGISPNKLIYKLLDILTNITRSIPFLILLILLIPFTKAIVGKSYGPTATIVPLVVAATPFIGRMVEGSLKEVNRGVLEAAQSMGASTMQIIIKVLLVEARVSLIVGSTIALGTVLGYSAMAGIVGGGGLGDVAIQYGYYRYDVTVMWVTVIILVLLVQILQMIGMKIAKKVDRRI
ncbi:MAG: methionine ABC transporter permease [Eubacteriales bacterium]